MALDSTRRRVLFITAGIVAGAVGAALLSSRFAPVVSAQGESITVSGCLERDAAARTAVYKLIARSGGSIQQYRLTATGGIDLGAELGHTIEVTGTLSRRESGGREEASIAVRQLKKISDTCS